MPPRRADPIARSRASADRLARAALAEDRWRQDRTSRAVVAPTAWAEGRVEAQAEGIVSGLAVARAAAKLAGLRVVSLARDGDRVRPGQAVLRLQGPARALFAIERTVLNVLLHASGIATLTAQAVARAGRGGPEIWATRKTLPGLRDLEKAAVIHGGGRPHRRDLADGLLLKTNHLGFGGLAESVRALRRAARPGESVQAEVRTAAQAGEAVAAGATALLIDNVRPAPLRRIVRAVRRTPRGRGVWIEASGGITLRNLTAYARTGVNAVSLGMLTHSAPALPWHLVVRPIRRPRRRTGRWGAGR